MRRPYLILLPLILTAGQLTGCDSKSTVPGDDAAQGAQDLAQPDGPASDSRRPDGPAPDATPALDLALQPDAPSPDQGVTADAGAGTCARAKLSTKQALLARIAALKWTSYSPSSSGPVAISSPLTISGTLTVNSKELKPPPGCTVASTCLTQVLFARGLSTGALPAGISFGAKVSTPITVYQSVTLSNTTVRLRAVVENVHPWTSNFIPVIRIEPDCQSSCPKGSQVCSASDQLCYAGASFCRLCLGLNHKQCACRDFAKIKADGTACSYLSKTMSSLCQGKCAAGTCVYQGKPDVYCP